jgi:hypothetical protein
MSLFCNKKIRKESGITTEYELLRMALHIAPRAKTKQP